MKRWIAAGALGLLLCALQFSAFADEKKAPVKTPNVTRDNFVSLRYESVGGIAGLRTEIAVWGGMLRLEAFPRLGGVGLMSGTPLDVPPPSAPLSNNQLKAFIEQINKAKLTTLIGNYRQPNLADGFNETLTLTISDDQNRDRSFVIQNYGNTAPHGFYQMTESLRRLRLDKFRGTSEAASTEEGPVTRQNLDSITLETSGGFANLQSSLKVWPHHPFSDFREPALIWTQGMAGREPQARRSPLTDEEMSELIRLANAANLPQLNGKKFRQPNLYDGLNEVLMVKLSDGRQFTVENYGNQAPPEYYALTRYLNELKNKKLNK